MVSIPLCVKNFATTPRRGLVGHFKTARLVRLFCLVLVTRLMELGSEISSFYMHQVLPFLVQVAKLMIYFTKVLRTRKWDLHDVQCTNKLENGIFFPERTIPTSKYFIHQAVNVDQYKHTVHLYSCYPSTHCHVWDWMVDIFFLEGCISCQQEKGNEKVLSMHSIIAHLNLV